MGIPVFPQSLHFYFRENVFDLGWYAVLGAERKIGSFLFLLFFCLIWRFWGFLGATLLVGCLLFFFLL